MRSFQIFTMFVPLLVGALALGNADATIVGNLAQSMFHAQDQSHFFGNSRVKLVFVSSGRLYYVDFSENCTQLCIHLMDSVPAPVMAPVISPDGGWVVYAAPGSDGRLINDMPNDSSIKSSAWVCRLTESAVPILAKRDSAHVPRFIQNSDTMSILYSTVGIGKAWAGWENGGGTGEVRSIKIPDGFPVGKEDTIFNGFACYGGLSYDHHYLSTAIYGDGARMVRIGEGEPVVAKIHWLSCDNSADSFWLQVCNPSISSSRVYTDAMLYYDVGNLNHSCVVADHSIRWADHSLLFISRFSGNVVKCFGLPEELPQLATVQHLDSVVAGGQLGGLPLSRFWNNPEWSNTPYYAVSGVANRRLWWLADSTWHENPLCEYLCAINLRDSSFLPILSLNDTSLASTTAFSYPWLWVEVPSDFQEDSNWLEPRNPVSIHLTLNTPAGISRNIRNESLKYRTQIFTMTGRLIRELVSSNEESIRRTARGLPRGLYVIQQWRSSEPVRIRIVLGKL
jgi:hypothetical protein